MNKKLRKVLADKCADFGLTPKALDELSSLGAAGLKDDATDEEIAAKADSLVPYAKAMQGEISRKTKKHSAAQHQQSQQTEENNGGEGNDQVAQLLAKYNERLTILENENKSLKAEKAQADRAATIAKKAKKLGIPDFLISGRTFAEDADIDKELADFKQQLVNHNLVQKDQSHATATTTEQMTSEEDAWAKSLPGNN